MKYDAFISYSHFQDKELSIAIQKGLGKIAKPWYKIRNLNVFRDEDSLSASPKLWNNIESALEESKFFIYVASRTSSQSKWVEKEIDWWIKNKSVESILIVHGDNDENISLPLPKNLESILKKEPFYTDLRKTKINGEYSLKNPSFVNELIKLAAHIHGKEPKDLLSDDLKNHKRTLLIRKASQLLIFFFIVLLGFFIFNSYELQNKKSEAFSNYLISQARLMSSSNKALSIYFYNYFLNPTETNYTLLNTFYKSNSVVYTRDSIMPAIGNEFAEFKYSKGEGDNGHGIAVNINLPDRSTKDITLFLEDGAHSFFWDKSKNVKYYYGPSNYHDGISDFVLLEIDYTKKEVNFITDEIPFFDFTPTLLFNNGCFYIYCEWFPIGGENHLFYKYCVSKGNLKTYDPPEAINSIPFTFSPSPDNKYLYVETRHTGNNGVMDRVLLRMDINNLEILDSETNFGFQFNNRQIFGAWFSMQKLRNDYYESLDYNSVMGDEDYIYPNGDYMLLPMGNSLWLTELESEETEPLHFFTTNNAIGNIEDINYRVNGFDVLSGGRVFSWDYYEGDDYLDENHYYDYRYTIPNTFKAMESFHRFNDLSSSNEDIAINIDDMDEINDIYAEEIIYGGSRGKFISVTQCKIVIEYYDNYFTFNLCKEDLPKGKLELRYFFNKNGFDFLTGDEKIELGID